MKIFETKNIVLEFTEEEVERLIGALNSAGIRRREQGCSELADELDEMWCKLYEIKKQWEKNNKQHIIE